MVSRGCRCWLWLVRSAGHTPHWVLPSGPFIDSSRACSSAVKACHLPPHSWPCPQVSIMVEMERNYITAEYFRTIQVSSGSTVFVCRRWLSVHACTAPAARRSNLNHLPPSCSPHPLPPDGQDAGWQGDVHAGRAAGDGRAGGQPRGEALQAHHQPSARLGSWQLSSLWMFAVCAACAEFVASPQLHRPAGPHPASLPPGVGLRARGLPADDADGAQGHRALHGAAGALGRAGRVAGPAMPPSLSSCAELPASVWCI